MWGLLSHLYQLPWLTQPSVPMLEQHADAQIWRMPPELILEIFQMADNVHRDRPGPKDLPPVLILRAVCRFWKALADRTPSLWDAIPLHSPKMTSLFLKHSVPSNIYLSVKGWPASVNDPDEDAVAAALKHLSRTRALSINSANEMEDGLAIILHNALQEMAVPELKSLEIINSSSALPDVLFSGRVPKKLKVLRLLCEDGQDVVLLRTLDLLFRALFLTVLELRDITPRADNQPYLIEAIRRMQNLRDLAIYFREDNSEKVALWQGYRTVTLPSAEQVSIEAALPDLVNFASVFAIPPEAEFTLSCGATGRPATARAISTHLQKIKRILQSHFAPLLSRGFKFHEVTSTASLSTIDAIDGSFTFRRPVITNSSPKARLPQQFTLKYRFAIDTSRITQLQTKEDIVFYCLLEATPFLDSVVDVVFCSPSQHEPRRSYMLFAAAQCTRSLCIDNIYPLNIMTALAYPDYLPVLPDLRLVYMSRIRLTERVIRYLAPAAPETTIGGVLLNCLQRRSEQGADPFFVRIRDSELDEDTVRKLQNLLGPQNKFKWDGRLKGHPGFMR